jgi:hypothetical protein
MTFLTRQRRSLWLLVRPLSTYLTTYLYLPAVGDDDAAAAEQMRAHASLSALSEQIASALHGNEVDHQQLKQRQ